MGLSIGQIPAGVAGLRASPDFGRARLRDEQPASASELRDTDAPKGLGFGSNSDEVPPVRVGFGSGTLSPQGAALRTINRTVEEVRRAQPSLAELRARFQDRSARTGSTDAPVSLVRTNIQRLERGIPEASGQARKFIHDVSAGVERAAARTSVDRTQNDSGGPSAQIGERRIPIANREATVRFDVRA